MMEKMSRESGGSGVVADGPVWERKKDIEIVSGYASFGIS